MTMSTTAAPTATLSGTTLTSVQQSFLDELPRLAGVIRFNTRCWPRHLRAEARSDALAAAWLAWRGLARRGHDPRAVGPCGIARNAVRYVRNGRRLGTGEAGRKLDLYDRRARRREGYRLVSLDRGEDRGESTTSDAWRDWLACDNTASPADQAIFHLDYDAWLDQLPERKRTIALLLAEGGSTGEVARATGVTPGRISQLRTWLAEDWAQFQGESPDGVGPGGPAVAC